MNQTPVTVNSLESVGPDTVAIEMSAPADFDARPGQFIRFSVPEIADQSRMYSISSPRTTPDFEITVSIGPDSPVGANIADLASGDEVVISGPFGTTCYDGEDRVTVLAGGVGIGPALGIAERTLEEGGEPTLIYRDDEPIHTKRVNRLAEQNGGVLILDAEERLREYAPDVIGNDNQIFVFGFSAFVEEANEALQAHRQGNRPVKIENFG